MAISLILVATLVIAVAGTLLVLTVGKGVISSSSTGGCCPPVFEVIQPNWRSLPVYNLSSSSLPQVLRGALSVNVSEPYRIAIGLSGTTIASYFILNVTVVENAENFTYSLAPNSMTPSIPSVKGTMWFEYAVLLKANTPAGRYEFDLQIMPVDAPSNYVGTQFPITVIVN